MRGERDIAHCSGPPLGRGGAGTAGGGEYQHQNHDRAHRTSCDIEMDPDDSTLKRRRALPIATAGHGGPLAAPDAPMLVGPVTPAVGAAVGATPPVLPPLGGKVTVPVGPPVIGGSIEGEAP